ncbi:hypothetical protein ACIBO2_16135 [Nonomuraea sp. NPDC050022]|uniref:hypothetical protein n=1 Tax=Nonomuraea sp. NPDC050022 TaxID=3364358 RepID=UPI00379D008F
MSVLEERLRQIMADETARLRAAPDLVERVLRSSRRKRKRVKLAAMAVSAAVVATAVPAFLILGPSPTTVLTPTVSTSPATPDPTQPDTPAIDDTPAPPSPTPDFGDLGDGRAFGRVKVGYLPDGLRWGNWSLNFGDKYTTSWNYDGDKHGFYCVQIYVYEGAAVQEPDDRVQEYRKDGKGEEVAIGDRTGYLITQNVGEDGGKGTPSLMLTMSEGRRAEVMISPVYAKKLGGAKTKRELLKIAEGLTAD